MKTIINLILNLFIENKNTNFTKSKTIKKIMYKLTLDALFLIYRLGFDRGLKRSTTVSNKILKEWFDELPEIKKLQGKNE